MLIRRAIESVCLELRGIEAFPNETMLQASMFHSFAKAKNSRAQCSGDFGLDSEVGRARRFVARKDSPRAALAFGCHALSGGKSFISGRESCDRPPL